MFFISSFKFSIMDKILITNVNEVTSPKSKERILIGTGDLRNLVELNMNYQNSLYNVNVRNSLVQHKTLPKAMINPVFHSMYQTLDSIVNNKGDMTSFLSNNNGITINVDDFKQEENNIWSVEGLGKPNRGINNGCQTVSNAWFFHINCAELPYGIPVFIQIQIGFSEERIKESTRAKNLSNSVKQLGLMLNDSWRKLQKEVETNTPYVLMIKDGEFKRGQTNVIDLNPGPGSIFNPLMAYFMKMPTAMGERGLKKFGNELIEKGLNFKVIKKVHELTKILNEIIVSRYNDIKSSTHSYIILPLLNVISEIDSDKHLRGKYSMEEITEVVVKQYKAMTRNARGSKVGFFRNGPEVRNLVSESISTLRKKLLDTTMEDQPSANGNGQTIPAVQPSTKRKYHRKNGKKDLKNKKHSGQPAATRF